MNTHYIYLADDLGIASVFPKIKELMLTFEHPLFSLLYYSSDENFVFKRELDILQRVYPAQFIVWYESIPNYDFQHQIQIGVEAILNANTRKRMCFTVSGVEDFSQICIDRLNFLGINEIKIQEQYFC